METVFQLKKSKHRQEIRQEKNQSSFKNNRLTLLANLQNQDSCFNNKKQNEMEETKQDSKENQNQQQNDEQKTLLTKIEEWFNEEQDYEAAEFAIQNNLIVAQKCIHCKKEMKLITDKNYCSNLVWRCRSCNQKLKFYSNNKVFIGFRTPISLLLKLFLLDLPSQTAYSAIQGVCDISSQVVRNARKIYLKILNQHYTEYFSNMRSLGSKGEVVELDESCFRRKYNRGRYRGQQWIFGIVERQGGWSRSIFVPVPNRSKETLIPIIEHFVSKKAKMVVSDQWRAYSTLQSLGYAHQTINHKSHFVRPAKLRKGSRKRIKQYDLFKGALIHTQTIESRWRHLKERLKRRHGKTYSGMTAIFESLFYLSYDIRQRPQKALQVLKEYIES